MQQRRTRGSCGSHTVHEQYTRPQRSVQSKRQEPRLVLNGGVSHFPILFWNLILFFSHFLFIGLKAGPSLGVPLRIQAIDKFLAFFNKDWGRMKMYHHLKLHWRVLEPLFSHAMQTCDKNIFSCARNLV